MGVNFQIGMQVVFLTAAELTRRGFIVSTTTRNAFGADLLVTDQRCKKAMVCSGEGPSGTQRLLAAK